MSARPTISKRYTIWIYKFPLLVRVLSELLTQNSLPYLSDLYLSYDFILLVLGSL